MLAFYGLSPRADKGAMMIFDRLASLPTPLLVVAAVIFGGCEISSGPGGPSSGLTCIDDSPDCISRRQRTLQYLVEDNDRAWVKAHAPAAAYASGVRLFAFKRKKHELSCEELAYGRNEADKAPSILRGPAGKDMTPAQVSRGLMLASEVSRELKREIKRRC
jgi:hypothetical protein